MVSRLHLLERRGIMSLVERIKALCEQQKLTIAELERKLNFGNGTIRRWDNSAPSTDRILKVSEFFHVSVDYLLGNVRTDTSGVQIVPRDEGKVTKEDMEIIQNILGAVFDGKYYIEPIDKN